MSGVHGYDLGNSGTKASGRADRVLLPIKHFRAQRLCFFPWRVLISYARLQAGGARHAAGQGGDSWQVAGLTQWEHLRGEGRGRGCGRGSMLAWASPRPRCPGGFNLSTVTKWVPPRSWWVGRGEALGTGKKKMLW